MISNYNWSITDGGYDCLLEIVNNELDSIKIYPNPVTSHLFINGDNTITKIRVFNMLGEQIIMLPFINHIDLSSLNSGVYFLELSNDTKTSIRKIVKE